MEKSCVCLLTVAAVAAATTGLGLLAVGGHAKAVQGDETSLGHMSTQLEWLRSAAGLAWQQLRVWILGG